MEFSAIAGVVELLESIKFGKEGAYQVTLLTLMIWFSAGFIGGALLAAKRPLGILGDLIGGVLGGMLAGFFVSATGFSFTKYITGLPEGAAIWVNSFLTALVGALVVLIIMRVLIKKR